MVFDSLELLSAGLLFAASISAWFLSAPSRAGVRLYLRFAAVLFSALALSVPLQLSLAAVLFLLPLASAALMIAAFARFTAPLPVFAASLALVLALGSGFAAMLWGHEMLALLPVLIAGLAVVGVALRGIALVAAMSGAALLAAGLVMLEPNALSAVLLFAAAALVGLAKTKPGLRENQLLRSSTNAMRGQARLA
ncbi:MAG TPA: hypothetical protein VFI23_18940 [Rhizomicrobium sp.]|nr:hypothetical protein [Rhizomicrobium sp.]